MSTAIVKAKPLETGVLPSHVKRKHVSVLSKLTIEENAELVANYFERELAPGIEFITPNFEKLFYDFAHLKADETIMGSRTQDDWCQKYLKRTARAVRYMFEGGNTNRKPNRTENSPAGTVNFDELPGEVRAGMMVQVEHPVDIVLVALQTTVVATETVTQTFYVIRNLETGKFDNVAGVFFNSPRYKSREHAIKLLRAKPYFKDGQGGEVLEVKAAFTLTPLQLEPDSVSDLTTCSTCPRCWNQEDIQPLPEKNGHRVRRYHCTKCDLKTGCKRFTPQTGVVKEAMAVQP